MRIHDAKKRRFRCRAQTGSNLRAQKEGAEPPHSGPTPHFRKLLGQAHVAPGMLDSPASRDQVDDSNNQSDHQ